VDSVNGRKRYSNPTFRKLNREQALLFLLGHARDGDPEAQEMLELLSCDLSEEHSEPEP
jgi:hypothetical protein